MAGYKPSTPFTVPLFLLIPTYNDSYGVTVKEYPDEGIQIFGSFRTFGGTERDVNGILSVENTATVETWFRPDITSDCRIKVSGSVYEILGTPENIGLRNQFMVLKIREIKGGA